MNFLQNAVGVQISCALRTPVIRCGLAALVVFGVSGLAHPDDPAGSKIQSEDTRMQRFLRSLSLTPLKRTPSESPREHVVDEGHAADRQQLSKKIPESPAKSDFVPPSASDSLLGNLFACEHCGALKLHGQCSGGMGPCRGGSLGGLGQIGSEKGTRFSPGDSQAESATAGGGPAMSTNRGIANGTPESAMGREIGTPDRDGHGGRKMAGPGRMLPRSPQQSLQGDPESSDSAQSVTGDRQQLESGQPDRSATNLSKARQVGNDSAQPRSEDMATSRQSASAGGGAAVMPLDWEIVTPAGTGEDDWQPAARLKGSETDGAEEGSDAKQLNGGVIRGSFQTGPNNPLILPPQIASVVYVIDVSQSMTGSRYQRVASAVVDAVQRMDSGQKFAILLFNTEAMQARGSGFYQATDANATRLRSALATISPHGGTNPQNALLLAIQLQPEAILVLSDGEFEEQVVHRVTRLNRSSGINSQINCVAIGQRVRTLQLLASLNGPGNYAEVAR